MTDHRTDDGSEDDRTTLATELTYELDQAEHTSEAVVRAVASLTDTPVLDLDPLYHAVDPEYLDGLFDGADGLSGSSLSFTYHGCLITVTPGTVHVRTDGQDTR